MISIPVKITPHTLVCLFTWCACLLFVALCPVTDTHTHTHTHTHTCVPAACTHPKTTHTHTHTHTHIPQQSTRPPNRNIWFRLTPNQCFLCVKSVEATG